MRRTEHIAMELVQYEAGDRYKRWGRGAVGGIVGAEEGADNGGRVFSCPRQPSVWPGSLEFNKWLGGSIRDLSFAADVACSDLQALLV
ncbi:hypothetical protein AAFF_G00054260 [Aldrovandia affinis]|uniref:Uncharacterized protein n=1 Tax=Aldrovandia affinis TaxID=143900 RepID=A0AAD7S171_9TELE|nr:hypothetical protein AAFF_G00054260 [Aldrovandia affinis]